jgi:hypothetical protein
MCYIPTKKTINTQWAYYMLAVNLNNSIIKWRLNMKLRHVVFVMGSLLLLFSCVQPAYQRSTPQTFSSIHQYNLLVKDINGNPIAGVDGSYTIEREHKEYNSGKFSTNADGKFSKSVSYISPYQYIGSKFSSTLKYKIAKDGYYTTSGSQYVLYDEDKTVNGSVTLLKPTDYINPAFLSSPTGNELKVNILAFIDLIRLQSLLANADLKPQTISLINFKDEDYLQFTFVSSNAYNSLRMNKYDIGKRLFDDVVRKVLNPLNEHISNPKAFYGYDLKVIGYTKNFADKYSEYSAGTPIEYRFMIPEGIVKKYKNKDISGQQVLDASVILMDDERIELKLQ